MIERAAQETLLLHDSVAPAVVGVGAAERMIPRLGGRTSALLLIDASVSAQHPALRSQGRSVIEFDPRGESQSALLDRAQAVITHRAGSSASSARIDGIIAVGGGSVLDAAKLLRLLFVSASSFHSARHSARSFGLAVLPDRPLQAQMRLALIPTTLGTGSEASAVACLHDDGEHRSRRLVAGGPMRADTIVLDPRLTRSLDDQAIREGAAEILLRILGSYIGSPPREVPDHAAHELVVRVATLTAIGVRQGFDDRIREALAVASAETHRGWAMAGRDPFAAKHWYLANELSSAALLRKVPVTLRLLPMIWRRIIDGDARFGDSARLRDLWRKIAGPLSLAEDPVDGSEEWATRWAITSPVPAPDTIATAARRCVRTWGGDRPALRGLTEADVLAIYGSAFPVNGHERNDVAERR